VPITSDSATAITPTTSVFASASMMRWLSMSLA
jgi:hypothetical protein